MLVKSYTRGRARKLLAKKRPTDWGFGRFPVYGILPDFGEMNFEMIKKKKQ